MAIINYKYKYVFLAEKHCASRVLSDVLRKQPDSVEIRPHHINSLELQSTVCGNLFADFQTCSVVRNPADILVTMHLANSFRGHMQHLSHELRSVFFQHSDLDGSGGSHTVLRYETLEADLNAFLSERGAPAVIIPYKKEYVTGGKKPWPVYYEKEDIDFLISEFPEIRAWGYADYIRQEWEKYHLTRRIL